MVKRFINLSCLFILPIFLLILFCCIILYMAGEFYRFNQLRPLQDSQQFGLAYSNVDDAYKLLMTKQYYKSDIVALGSSRIMQVRGSFVNKDYSFYNAGGAVDNIYKFDLFLSQLDYTPKLFIVSIDQWFFNPNYKNQKETFDKNTYQVKDKLDVFNKCISLIKDIIKGKVSFKLLYDNEYHSVGMNAIIKNNGFVSDGSYYYGDYIKNPSKQLDYNFKDTFKRIQNGNARFQYCDEADSSVLDSMVSFLSNCEQRGISVIAILPPFAPSVNKRMEEMGRYAYLNQVYDILLPVFNKYSNCYLYNYFDVSSMDLHDYDFVDGFHGSELVYCKILEDICKKNNAVQQFFIDGIAFGEIQEDYKNKQIKYHDL